MQYQLQVQEITPLQNAFMDVVILVGTPPNTQQQLDIKLPASATLTDFFKTIQSEMAEKKLIPSQFAIQYKQYDSVCQVPVFALLEQFSTIEIMTEELYNNAQTDHHIETPMEIEPTQPLIEKTYNVSCHRCKTRKNECLRCPINPKHKFCEGCITKYTTLDKFLSDGCPICQNKCQCASCKRKELKRLGIEAPIPKR
ncbi:hypothetical protein EHI8A_033890 [Entamoeba histolytica HM-1:IMSS-B]|uniref:RING-type domain-containing protein n=8 Tax=Entamoeba TaxID=5758 RepID=C4LZ62_ENTH1|nr:hypothetical protein ENU1_110800 [Entamoeba nuttalli P19]XP_655035.1 hypothetical protein EHI_104520 [Entamoeba histolytica HM-1:IMSS]EMD43722.1 Hypothetical protein EHI5A_057880 [Entamoeba histolytica KU27]EMH73942.1 hypothetical protein EHI8A_033890 [Entamoeba histolytica HM-1:IMSS-B]EMS12741.1 hypothetical protein KM1_074610 [Entamoeba histolytica HM-3:IMSS]ENY60877.1 hypothetical protein EHI7A_035760 [Entamoeba histolytica HM-1:IMSS-A]GAT94139.1 hypothetical protein CL6EHI_104520 [Enta|eukprot:XP_008857755.1 hypothetical protein ENU1_110800 [Entamoeba nuttalli P19]